MQPSKPAKKTDVIASPKKQTSLRGAKRRGNLYQVVVVPNEAARQRQEVATPSGLAMTSVLFGRLVQALPFSVGTIKSGL